MILTKEEGYESLSVRITKEEFPRLYENKVQCLMLSGLSREAAEIAVEGIEIELELLYEVGWGLFAVESEAVEADATYSPYTREPIIAID